MTIAIEQLYRYNGSSAAALEGDRLVVDLATAGGCGTNPVLAEGFVIPSHAAARALLLVAKVASTRFWTPPNMVAAAIRAADPVVTASPEGLNFESFSLCCGVYCRFDLDVDAFDGTIHRHGTTNVDVNAPLRASLSRVAEGDPLLLKVGVDDLSITTMDDRIIEKRVPLPERWRRGFAEVSTAQSVLEPFLTLQPAGLRRFVEGLPKETDHQPGWVTRSGDSARCSTRPSPGAISLGGASRLRVIREVAPLIRSLTGFGQPGTRVDSSGAGSTAWVAEIPGGRVTIALSPGPARGFSGEGSLLLALATARRGAGGELDPRVQQLADASAGRLGYDVSKADWFARDLPFDLSVVDRAGGRLENARALVGAGSVVIDGNRMGAIVNSGLDAYRVRLVDDEWRCTCPWWGKHRDDRGPCKHVLATVMSLAPGV